MSPAAQSPDADKIASMLHDQCLDWNGAPMSDEEETRNAIYCGQIRALLAERGRLLLNLRHWREECGKLHAHAAASPDMLVALMAVDASWTEEFPDGPDGSRNWNNVGTLSSDTVAIWRSIRSAIAKADGRSLVESKESR